MYYYRGGDYTPTVPQGFDAFSRWFNWAFQRFQEKWQVWLIQGLISFAFMLVFGVMSFIYSFFFIMRSGGFGSASSPIMPNFGQFFIVYAGLSLISIVFYSFFFAGMLNTAMKQAQGEEIAVGDMFSGGRAMLPVMGASLVVFIPYIIGVYLCLIPGLVWLAFTWLTIPLVVTRRMGVFEAVGKSMAIARQNFWLFALYGLVAAMLAGMVAFLSMPAHALLHVAVIAEIYGVINPEQMPQPISGSLPPPPTSYSPPPIDSPREPPPPPEV